MMHSTTNHLTDIVVRQQKTGLRDLMFVAFLALATIVGVTSVTTSVAAASTHVAVQK